MLTWFVLLLIASNLYSGESLALPGEPHPVQNTHVETHQLDAGVRPSRNRDSGNGKEAYVTLLYGGFLLGARVLGQSLRETGTTKELIALCTEAVPEENKKVLEADGWTIKEVSNINSPYDGLSSRGTYFSGIFTKLYTWNMTEYSRIIYLDADAIVVSNIDHMFDCGTFCASYRHSDLFNAGVIVVEPSKAIFRDMMRQISKIPSYDDGDQGFLNIYFSNLKYAPMFNWSNSSRQRQPMRMPSGLNTDVGMYYVHSHWLVPESAIKVIHYTLGPIKPWIWWSNFLFDLNWKWNDFRKRLPQYQHTNDKFRPLLPIFWAPIPLLMLLYTFTKVLRCSSVCSNTTNEYLINILKLLNSFNSKYSHFLPLLVGICSYRLAYYLIPTAMLPNQAEFAFWLWSNFFLFVFFGFYCHFSYIASKLSDNSHYSIPRKKLVTFVLYLVYIVSYILIKVLVPAVHPFGRRVRVFLIVMALHIAVCQFVGQKIIQIWSGGKFSSFYSNSSDPNSIGTKTSKDRKYYCY